MTEPEAASAVARRPTTLETRGEQGRNGDLGLPAAAAAARAQPMLPMSPPPLPQTWADTSPNELFKKVVVNDAIQNSRLTAKFNSLDRGNKAQSGGAPAYSKGPTKMRFVVCTLGLMSLAMSQMSRMVINQSLTQMIDPSMQAAKGDDDVPTDGSCPWPAEELPMVSSAPTPIMSSAATLQPTTASALINDANPMTTMGTPPGALPTSRPAPARPIDPYPTSAPITTTTTTRGGAPNSGANLDELPDMEQLLDVEDQVTGGSLNLTQQQELATTAAPTATLNRTPRYEQFMWTMKQQGLVLGGFYYSYFVFMILGGRMAEIYGAKYIILLAVAGSALINLATPWMARTNFVLLVMSRVLMGAIQSGVFPAMYALIAKWLTMSEASIFAPLIKMNLRLGMVFGSLIPGLVPGWPNVFYFTGVASALWSLAWIFVATSDPADNKWVSPGELAHINRKKKRTKQQQQRKDVGREEPKEMIEMVETTAAGGVGNKQKEAPAEMASHKTPWLKIWTAPSVIGLIVVKLTFNYALDFLAIELPSYLKYVHHASRQTISAITTPMFGIQVFLIVFVGWLAKVTIQRRPLGMTKTTIRKVFQSAASLGLSLFFFLLTFNDCNLAYVAVLLQIISFLSMFTAGGETMLPYDLSEEYPATIMSIANSIANVSGVTTTTLAAIILGDQGGSYHRWNVLIYLIAGANLIGGLTFIALIKAEPIDFGPPESKEAASRKRGDIEAPNSNAALERRPEGPVELGVLPSPLEKKLGEPASPQAAKSSE